jgi:hypothetical protein
MRRLRATILVTLVAGLALAACGGGSDVIGKGAEGAIEDATGCDIEGRDEAATVRCEGKNGSGSFSVGSQSELPDGFPKGDVPMPKGDIVSAVATDTDKGKGYNVTVKVDGSLSDAADDYRRELEDAGFTVDDDASFSLGSRDAGITAFKAESTAWDVHVVGSGGGDGNTDINGLNVTVTAAQS